MEDQKPVTRGELKVALDEMAVTLKKDLTDDLTSVMRQIETNMLTAFHSYSQGMTARLHTMEQASLARPH